MCGCDRPHGVVTDEYGIFSMFRACFIAMIHAALLE